jgi:hypothetical protein
VSRDLAAAVAEEPLVRGCSTQGCRRIPRVDWAMCDQCAGELLRPHVSPRARVARLSETDPVSQLMKAEMDARRER